MEKSETGLLVAYVRSIQGGEVTRLDVEAWHDVLGHLGYDDAKAAAKAHASESTDHLKPAHILQRVRDQNARALPRTMSPEGKDCTKLGRPSHTWAPDSATCLFCEQVAF